jgi:hypothetical protein
MGDMKLMIGDADEGIVFGPEFSAVYNLAPVDSELDADVLIKAGEAIATREYVPLKPREGLKLQSLPFGFDTGILF